MASLVERVQKFRAGLRQAGMRPVQIRVPDTRRQGLGEECKRQSALVSQDRQGTAILEFLDKAADREGWST